MESIGPHNKDNSDSGKSSKEKDEYSLFTNYSLLSHIAVRLHDKVPRATHNKGGVGHPRAFTGRDIVTTIQTLIQHLTIDHDPSLSDRYFALQIARSLHDQLFFRADEGRMLEDGIEEVFMLYDERGDEPNVGLERAELPTGVVTLLTHCYSPSCSKTETEVPCYAFSCPKRKKELPEPTVCPIAVHVPLRQKNRNFRTIGSNESTKALNEFPQCEIERHEIITHLIDTEEQYIMDLDLVESVFLEPLRAANPPVIPDNQVAGFTNHVFRNVLELRDLSRQFLEALYARHRKQQPVIRRIGDIFMNAVADFCSAYPTYIAHHMNAEERLRDELERNQEFKFFLERCSMKSLQHGQLGHPDLRHLLSRPSDQLEKYPAFLDSILEKTEEENPDVEFLKEAIQTMAGLRRFVQLRAFQAAMGRGPSRRWEWHDLVSREFREILPYKEVKRQSVIFELIKGEIAYVKDLQNIKMMYVNPLRSSVPPIIPQDRLERFIDDVFHNYWDLYEHHHRLLERLFEVQRNEHPCVISITAAMQDAALNFHNAYLEYISNYPIAAYKIDNEITNNPAFGAFVERQIRHQDSHRFVMKDFINRPIPRLERYEQLLREIMNSSPEGHSDHSDLPSVIKAITSVRAAADPGFRDATVKVDLWGYSANLVFKHGETFDVDLFDKKRQLIHSGKLLGQPDSKLEWNGWSELFVLLLDNYLVITKPKEKDGVTKYNVHRRPIPLKDLSLINFTDLPISSQRHASLLQGTENDSRFIYPMTINDGRSAGGSYTMYAESSESRVEWREKLAHALAMRGDLENVDQD
ncbi:hypothetical protein D9756_002198 [Leucocoprinus leucothites]|uniref:Dbl homology domain-containing protein n=1 Tax=Leucocoprinus leucothites TaxID=201217 RepID=A0A8H5GBM9_9AGAR|nr:hypothetical protein D9756_002198 [Leucoagaricus leucothites]